MEVEKALKNREEKKARKPVYLRSDWHKRSRVGRGRKKLQVWRRAKGRHNKIREQRKGKPSRPEIGYGSPKSIRGFIGNLKPVYVSTLEELSKLSKDDLAIINGNLGMKKKIEIFKKAQELGIKTNLPPNFLEKVEEFLREKKARREEFEKVSKEKEKKAKEKAEAIEKKKEEEEKKKEMAKEIEKEKEETKKAPVEKIHEVKTKGIEKKGAGYHRQALEK
ncbi:MAG: eL32 family ribosomal protein [Candidatus Pacearchaeota archaeon]